MSERARRRWNGSEKIRHTRTARNDEAWPVGHRPRPVSHFGQVTDFIGECEKRYMGGFSKVVDDDMPDILHSFYSLCWLSLVGERDLRPLNSAFQMCRGRLDEGGGAAAAEEPA